MQTAHWSEPFVKMLRSVTPELRQVPLYLLMSHEWSSDWQPEWLGTFSWSADLRARSVLESLGLWSGRGICLTVRADFEEWSARGQRGILLHELSHAIEYLTQPDALCDMEELGALELRMLEVGEAAMLAEFDICQDEELSRAQHGPAFVRLAMHLFWRARQKTTLAPRDLGFLAADYALPENAYEAVEDSLRSELGMSWNLDLRRLREPPEAFMRLFE